MIKAGVMKNWNDGILNWRSNGIAEDRKNEVLEF
jgi:hypothetical protein